jgi:multidrug resistance efflux pump
MPARTGRHLHTIAVLGALAGAAGISLFLIIDSGVAPQRAPGVVHTTEIKIAPEISGRLARFTVTQGQSAHRGDEFVERVNPELSAALVLANALRIRAPSDGTVALIVAEPGEAIVPGQPVMTLEAAGRRLATFNLREDQLDGLRIGSPIELLPVGGSDRIQARVAEIIPRGESAVWRAARVVGDHDLNTFLVRADPVVPAAAMQSGMTV